MFREELGASVAIGLVRRQFRASAAASKRALGFFKRYCGPCRGPIAVRNHKSH